MLFDKNDFTLDDVYSSLTLLNTLKEEIQKAMWHNTKIYIREILLLPFMIVLTITLKLNTMMKINMSVMLMEILLKMKIIIQ